MKKGSLKYPIFCYLYETFHIKLWWNSTLHVSAISRHMLPWIATDSKYFDFKASLRINLEYNFLLTKMNSHLYCQNKEGLLGTNESGLKCPKYSPNSLISVLNWRKMVSSSTLNNLMKFCYKKWIWEMDA